MSVSILEYSLIMSQGTISVKSQQIVQMNDLVPVMGSNVVLKVGKHLVLVLH